MIFVVLVNPFFAWSTDNDKDLPTPILSVTKSVFPHKEIHCNYSWMMLDTWNTKENVFRH